MTPRGLPRLDAAQYIGCSPSKLDLMVLERTMPQPRMVGAKPVWDRYELDEAFTALPHKGESVGNEWDEIEG